MSAWACGIGHRAVDLRRAVQGPAHRQVAVFSTAAISEMAALRSVAVAAIGLASAGLPLAQSHGALELRAQRVLRGGRVLHAQVVGGDDDVGIQRIQILLLVDHVGGANVSGDARIRQVAGDAAIEDRASRCSTSPAGGGAACPATGRMSLRSRVSAWTFSSLSIAPETSTRECGSVTVERPRSSVPSCARHTSR